VLLNGQAYSFEYPFPGYSFQQRICVWQHEGLEEWRTNQAKLPIVGIRQSTTINAISLNIFSSFGSSLGRTDPEVKNMWHEPHRAEFSLYLLYAPHWQPEYVHPWYNWVEIGRSVSQTAIRTFVHATTRSTEGMSANASQWRLEIRKAKWSHTRRGDDVGWRFSIIGQGADFGIPNTSSWAALKKRDHISIS